MSQADEARELLKTKINAETAEMPWDELARYFARGIVVHVTEGLDLVEIALAISEDDTAVLTPLSEKGLVRRATDDDAKRWVAESTRFWAVVVAPWLIVQPMKAQ